MSAAPSHSAGPVAVATIDVTGTEKGVRVVARALALSRGTFEARMTIAKSGPSGRTETTQGGKAVLDAGASADIAMVGLSMSPGDRLEVELVVSTGGVEVSRSSLVVGDQRS